MTIKIFFLNPLLNCKTILLLFSSFYLFAHPLLIDSCLANSPIPSSTASDNILPPPPPLSPPKIIIKTKDSLAPPANINPPRSVVQQHREEYIFQAPNTIKNSYRIEVLGKSKLILQQVRAVESKAFIKGNVIQVGIFSEEANARELVEQLALKGLWVRILAE